MKTIGLLGGMSWESTATYYFLLNKIAKQELGGLHSAKILLDSQDFAEIVALQKAADWDKCAQILGQSAKNLEAAGADYILICTNTMHKVADQVQDMISIPLIHIADETSAAIKNKGLDTIGLLGTKYTMTQDFYRQRLEQSGLNVVVPTDEQVEVINNIIFDELCVGTVQDESRQQYLDIMQDLKDRGAQGIILGCTEIGLLVDESHTDLPLFDTTHIHAGAAMDHALH